MDNQGFFNELNACFNIHRLSHARWAEVPKGASASGTPEFGVPDWRPPPAVKPAGRSTAEAGVPEDIRERSGA